MPTSNIEPMNDGDFDSCLIDTHESFQSRYIRQGDILSIWSDYFHQFILTTSCLCLKYIQVYTSSAQFLKIIRNYAPKVTIECAM